MGLYKWHEKSQCGLNFISQKVAALPSKPDKARPLHYRLGHPSFDLLKTFSASPFKILMGKNFCVILFCWRNIYVCLLKVSMKEGKSHSY